MKTSKPNQDTLNLIIRGSMDLGVPVNAEAARRLCRHLELIRLWSRRVDLTALDNLDQMAVLHVVDSLTVFKVLPLGSAGSFLDVGTGAGFPGLVMRIVDPSIRITLLDRTPGKIVFLKHAAHELGLTGIRFLNVSLGAFTSEPQHPTFDVVVSRAFSSDPSVIDGFHVLLKDGGSVIRMAGPGSVKASFPLPNLARMGLWEGNLPSSSGFRRVIKYGRSILEPE
ncbi:MAG: 16S rRNA (guanine(527)-N(7))-methyltransferase RsmG [Pseudomonadota bacterium]